MWESAQKMLTELCQGSNFDSIVDVLTLNPSAKLSSAWSSAGAVYNNIMVPVALGLMIIWFLVKLMERSTNEQLTLEQFFMVFVKLIAAKFLIDNGLEIFTQMWSLGISLVNKVSGVFGGGTIPPIDEKVLWKDLTGYDWTPKKNFILILPAWAQLLLPWLVSKIMIACAYFICYSRLIEMLIRMCGAPVALSDFMNEGLHGAGWRYLKNFMAICLQGMMILIISRLYSVLMADIFANPPTGFWNTVLMQLSVSFAAIALMFKSLSVSKELLGTG